MCCKVSDPRISNIVLFFRVGERSGCEKLKLARLLASLRSSSDDGCDGHGGPRRPRRPATGRGSRRGGGGRNFECVTIGGFSYTVFPASGCVVATGISRGDRGGARAAAAGARGGAVRKDGSQGAGGVLATAVITYPPGGGVRNLFPPEATVLPPGGDVPPGAVGPGAVVAPHVERGVQHVHVYGQFVRRQDDVVPAFLVELRSDYSRRELQLLHSASHGLPAAVPDDPLVQANAAVMGSGDERRRVVFRWPEGGRLLRI